MSLRESERATLRDWYDQSGRWIERMTALYRLVEEIAARREEAARLEVLASVEARKDEQP